MDSSTVTQLVFVDDADPGIVYQGNWAASLSDSTELASLEYPQRARTPWYGTVHTQSSTGGFSYIFNGTTFSVFFLTFDANTVTSCEIDGVQQQVKAGFQGIECRNNATLSAERHNLSVTLNAFDKLFDVSPNEVIFDGLFYTPSRFPDSGVDIAFQSSLLPEERRGIGDTLDFEFNGLSIGIYCLLDFPSSNTTSLSYFVDDGPPITFPISRPTKSPSVAALDFQLIIQTPRLSPGSHTIHIAGLNDHPSDINILPRQFIVQNTTLKPTELEPVPAISNGTPSNSTPSRSTLSITSNVSILASTSSSTNKMTLKQSPTAVYTSTTFDVSVTTTSSSPSSTSSIRSNGKTHISIGTIAGISTATFTMLVALVLILCYWQRASKKKRKRREDDPSNIILPFSAPDPRQLVRFRLPQYIPRKDTEKYRQALGINISHSTTEQSQDNGVIEEQLIEGPVQPPGVRYRVHEDGGQIGTSETEQIIDLPPIYGTFGNEAI